MISCLEHIGTLAWLWKTRFNSCTKFNFGRHDIMSSSLGKIDPLNESWKYCQSCCWLQQCLTFAVQYIFSLVVIDPGQLSLAIPLWVGAMSTSKNPWVCAGTPTTHYTSLASVVLQCELVSGWALRKQTSALSYRPLCLGRTLHSTYTFHHGLDCIMLV